MQRIELLHLCLILGTAGITSTSVASDSVPKDEPSPQPLSLHREVISGVCSFLVGTLCGILTGVGVVMVVLKWRKKSKETLPRIYDDIRATTNSLVEVPMNRLVQQDLPYYATVEPTLETNAAYGAGV